MLHKLVLKKTFKVAAIGARFVFNAHHYLIILSRIILKANHFLVILRLLGIQHSQVAQVPFEGAV